MDKKEIAKRYGLLVIGLFFAALGVAFTKRGELGVSPISSVANVLSYQFTDLTLGSWLILWNCVLILGQILLLRRNFQPIQFLQIPLSFLFGWFTDFGMWLVSFLPAQFYAVRLLMVLVGIVVLGFGITLSVIANQIMNSGEAFVKAISDVTQKEFGTIKVGFDVACVVIALVLSLLFFEGSIVGTREGTILSALFTGFVVKFFSRRLTEPLNARLSVN